MILNKEQAAAVRDAYRLVAYLEENSK